jgi:hypothetical protein
MLKKFVEIFGKRFYHDNYYDDHFIIDELPLKFLKNGKSPDISDIIGLERLKDIDGLTLSLGSKA